MKEQECIFENRSSICLYCYYFNFDVMQCLFALSKSQHMNLKKKIHQSFRCLKISKCLADSFGLHLNVWLTYLHGWKSHAFTVVPLKASISRIIIFFLYY